MLGWTFTGIIFLTKPGYEGAYHQLAIKKYPIDSPVNISSDKSWDEIKLVKSILGLHILVKEEGNSKNIDPDNLQVAKLPSEDKIIKLVTDAIEGNTERYGKIESIDGLTLFTNTGIEITLNWNTLSLSQHGNDRRVIETLYKIHYLQWTGWDIPNRFMGIAGLFSLAMLSIFGFVIYLKSAKK